MYITPEEAITLAPLKVAGDDLPQRLDRAAAAVLYLSGMSVGAFGTMPLQAVSRKFRSGDGRI